MTRIWMLTDEQLRAVDAVLPADRWTRRPINEANAWHWQPKALQSVNLYYYPASPSTHLDDLIPPSANLKSCYDSSKGAPDCPEFVALLTEAACAAAMLNTFIHAAKQQEEKKP